MYIKDNIIWFYGSKVGKIENDTAYVDSRFDCGEMRDKLREKGFKIAWVTNELNK